MGTSNNRRVEETGSPALREADGYLSAEHKRRFTLIAGLLGAGCFVLQMVLPLAVMFIWMGGMMAFQTGWMRVANTETAAFHAGRIWYLERGLGLFFQKMFDFEWMFTPGAPPIGFALAFVAVGFFWPGVCLLAYSILEGRWGWTPGKGAVGIRVVGTDLKPCGLGRALLRNVLKLVDGFFNFMVGVMLVALTENWQRVGDMAARTVVIDIKSATLVG